MFIHSISMSNELTLQGRRKLLFMFSSLSPRFAFLLKSSGLLLCNREDFEKTGISSLVTVEVRDIQGEGFPEKLSGLADSVFLDLPQPWLAVPSAAKMLKQDGVVCSFSPCIEQVQRTCEVLRSDFIGK